MLLRIAQVVLVNGLSARACEDCNVARVMLLLKRTSGSAARHEAATHIVSSHCVAVQPSITHSTHCCCRGTVRSPSVPRHGALPVDRRNDDRVRCRGRRRMRLRLREARRGCAASVSLRLMRCGAPPVSHSATHRHTHSH